VNLDRMVEGILKRDPLALGKAITLLESDAPTHWPDGDQLLERLQKLNSNETLRLGFSGPPGVGKSTFLDTFGSWWVNQGFSIAVVAVDPSSDKSGGSILGDKTRMSRLAKSPMAFVRPSANRGRLGGVHASLPSVLMVLEKANFDLVVVETVGVGQSEVAIHSMVDQLILLMQPGSGDDLQGIKKGLLEYGDVFLVGKSDMSPQQANLTRQYLLSSIKILKGRDCPVFPISGLVPEHNQSFYDYSKSLKIDPERRKTMKAQWFQHLLESRVLSLLRSEFDSASTGGGPKRWNQTLRNYKERLGASDVLPFTKCSLD